MFHLVVPRSGSVSLVERLVPDEMWELFQRVVPPAPTRPQGGGRRRYGDRDVLAAIVLVATSGCTWRQLPPTFGASWQTVYRRFAEWSRAQVWEDLQRSILETPGVSFGSNGDPDWARCAIDSVGARAAAEGS